MRYDFDTVTDRRGTGCIKYDFQEERKHRSDLLPLWVADMDFRLPQEALEKVHRAVERGIFGYTSPMDDYYEAVLEWYLKRHGWRAKKEWITVTPGVVFALAAAVRAFTEEGDSVLIQQPVYYPFSEVITDNKRRLVNNELVYDGKSYSIDFDDFEDIIVKNSVKLFILCSPHNPVGRVWSKEELKKISEICLKHRCVVAADEIHGDFVWRGKHTVFASLSDETAENCIVCTSPSKTFNIAGAQISNIFIKNRELKEKFDRAVAAAGYSQVNTLGLELSKAVYECGGEWYEQMKAYVLSNIEYIKDFIDKYIPQIKVVEQEGLYLVWLDFGEITRDKAKLADLVENRARLWVDFGSMFGEKSAGFVRLNAACPKSIIETALLRLKEAVGAEIKRF